MSARYEADVTVTLPGEGEADVLFRALVDVVPCRSHGSRAEVDGGLEAWSEALGEWVGASDLGVSAKDEERALDWICEIALEDDSDSCVEWEGD